jgi:hypothetical protein
MLNGGFARRSDTREIQILVCFFNQRRLLRGFLNNGLPIRKLGGQNPLELIGKRQTHSSKSSSVCASSA